MLNVFLSWLLLFGPSLLVAQTPPQVPLNAQAQLQVPQPPVDVSSPVTATTSFDPPTARVGEKVFYRAAVDATESSVQWPETIPATAGLKFDPVARGQITRASGNDLRPLTVFLYEVRAAGPGHFVISNFVVDVYGRPQEMPAADLEVLPENAAAGAGPRQLLLNISDVPSAGVFLGQPFRARVLLPATAENEIVALREVQLDGDGFMTDKTAARQTVEMADCNGQSRPAFIFETTVTPIALGRLKLSAQGFTAGREFTAPISISAPVKISGGPTKYDFLVSDAVDVNVRPLPTEGELPGFTGAIGKFVADPPQLSTNRLRIGQPVQLKAAFHAAGDLTRFVRPDMPRSRDWQIIVKEPPGDGITLIPLTDETRETPAIPFSAFDPASGKYEDLTIPPLPVTVTGESLPVEISVWNEAAEKSVPLKLSRLAPAPGRAVTTLELPQSRGWLVGAQLAPVFGFLALWRWDRRRRFLEAHPEIVRRRQARRALRREKRKLQKAAAAGDAAAFARHAADALKTACAPHLPAHPQALVCADVLAQLDAADQNGRAGEIVRQIFAASGAQFAVAPQTQADLLALRSDTDAVLQRLEARL